MCKIIPLVVCLAGILSANAEKQFKSQAEYRDYSSATSAIAANDFAKALASLDSWQKDYPDSDYKDDRQFLYVLAYAGAKQPEKAMNAATGLLARPELASALPDAANQVRLLYTAAVAIRDVRVRTAEQLADATDAAHRLLAFDNKPQGLTDAAWAQARSQLQTEAKRTLLFVALDPGTRALESGDCAAAEAAFIKALQDNPDSVQAAWGLGSADLCLYKTQPSKAVPAIYAMARAAAIDPVKGMVDPKWQQTTVAPFLEKLFQQYHGADPAALEELKRFAAKSPFPPAGFEIQSAADIAHAKQTEFEKDHPQSALWMKIKTALSSASGETYFITDLKGAAVPQLRGILLDAKPSCRPTQLLIAVPMPDSDSPQAQQPEIALKLEAPLAGRPKLQTEIQWEGVPSAFVPAPFLLTMDTERSKITGIETTPCSRR